jgi:dienelactone hydrolase
MSRTRFAPVVLLVLMQSLAGAETPSTTTVALKAPDGITLKSTYYSPGRPGPGILLLHACNRDRSSWSALATDAAARGYHVLALDYRGYGESEGENPEDLQGQRAVVAEKWPGDIDAAFAWLTSQKGVDRNRIAAAGASCGVNQSLLLARRHPEVKTVVLLSGNATPPAREYLRDTPGLPVFAAASRDDGNAVDSMKWVLGWSRNEQNTFAEFEAAGHGTDMFAVEKGLPGRILDWFDSKLRPAPAVLPRASSTAPPTPVEKFWSLLTKPDGTPAARAMFDAARRDDPGLVLFPEFEMNAHGYSLLQEGNSQDAIVVLQMNVDAYPQSANTYDSLSDAHLAAGNRDEALRLAEKALAKLATDPQADSDFGALIRESAEKKIRELRKKQP